MSDLNNKYLLHSKRSLSQDSKQPKFYEDVVNQTSVHAQGKTNQAFLHNDCF